MTSEYTCYVALQLEKWRTEGQAHTHLFRGRKISAWRGSQHLQPHQRAFEVFEIGVYAHHLALSRKPLLFLRCGQCKLDALYHSEFFLSLTYQFCWLTESDRVRNLPMSALSVVCSKNTQPERKCLWREDTTPATTGAGTSPSAPANSSAVTARTRVAQTILLLK